VPRAPLDGTGLRLTATLASLMAAQQGAGIALVPERLARIALKEGSLCQIGTTGVPMFSDYVIVHPHASARKPMLRDICAFLLAG